MNPSAFLSGPRRFLRRILTLLSGRRTGVLAMSVMVALFCLTLIVPQWSDFSEIEYNNMLTASAFLRFANRLGLTGIFGSPAMGVAFMLLFSNLAVSFGERLRVLFGELDINRAKMAGRGASIDRSLSATPTLETLERLEAILQRHAYAIRLNRQRLSLTALHNRYSVLGSHLFHLSAVFFVAAMGLRLVTQFHGVIVVGEGETFGSNSQYLSTRPLRPAESRYPRDLAFTLERLTASYTPEGRLIDARAIIVPHGSETTTAVFPNHPFRMRDSSVRLSDYGVAPVFVLRDPAKRLEHRAAVRLLVYPPGREDSFQFPGTDVKIQARFFPGLDNNGGPSAPGIQPSRVPSMMIEFMHQGQPFQAVLRQGTQSRVGPYEMGFHGLKYWARFEVDRDAGRLPIYVALVIGFVGLAWRLLLPRSKIEADFVGETLRLRGRADYTQQPFESRLDKIVQEFERR